MKIRQQTNQPTNQEPATQSFNCRGLGVLATVKHWRRHDLSSVIRPRNRGHLHLNLRQRCLRLAVTPRTAVTSSWFFFFWGGGWHWIEDKSVLDFLVEFFFRFRFFFLMWRISKFISIVLACTQKFMNETNQIEIQKTKVTKIDKEKIVQRNVLCVPQTCRGICHRRGSRDAKGLSDLRKQGGFQAKIGSKNPLQNRCESHVVCDVCAYPHEQKTIFHATKIFRTNPIEICFVCGVPGWLCLLSELFHMEKSQPTNWDGSEPVMMSHSMRYTHRYYIHMPYDAYYHHARATYGGGFWGSWVLFFLASNIYWVTFRDFESNLLMVPSTTKWVTKKF